MSPDIDHRYPVPICAAPCREILIGHGKYGGPRMVTTRFESKIYVSIVYRWTGRGPAINNE